MYLVRAFTFYFFRKIQLYNRELSTIVIVLYVKSHV